jgi:hypothetical protein
MVQSNQLPDHQITDHNKMMKVVDMGRQLATMMNISTNHNGKEAMNYPIQLTKQQFSGQ